MKKTLRRCLLPLMLVCSGMAEATLLNPDFSQGLDHWQAAVSWTDLQNGTSGQHSGDIFGQYTTAFSHNGATLTLSTVQQQQREIWSLVLFQDLQLGPVASGQALWLQLDLLAMLSSADDFYFAQLRDLDSNDALDLSSGGRFEVTAWIGRNLTLEFGLQDNDFVLGDQLQLSALELQSTAVPAPASLVLFTTALLLLWRRQRHLACAGGKHHV
ncbi:hypothetical protein [Rheinheimera sp.]|uniref:hypothetical protein n=1 Tax=Rheinheimera sp. TaxID=1869214 RepID=UPI0027B97A50|nr:hypothetical protein [Rheinheimera sp.]